MNMKLASDVTKFVGTSSTSRKQVSHSYATDRVNNFFCPQQGHVKVQAVLEVLRAESSALRPLQRYGVRPVPCLFPVKVDVVSVKAVKARGAVELHLFLIPTLDGNVRSASRPGHFIPNKELPVHIHLQLFFVYKLL
jgi:hypothetical protein